MSRQPLHDLESYRQFIRDAAPYVSVVIGRKLTAKDAEKFSDEEMTKIALMIDERVKALGKTAPWAKKP